MEEILYPMLLDYLFRFKQFFMTRQLSKTTMYHMYQIGFNLYGYLRTIKGDTEDIRITLVSSLLALFMNLIEGLDIRKNK